MRPNISLPFLFLPILFFISLPILAQTSKSLKGTWEIRSQAGGLKGGNKTFPKGNGNFMEFSSNEYKHIYKGKVIEKGKYIIVRKVSSLSRKTEEFIQYLPSKSPLEFYSIKSDSLFMFTDIRGGGQHVYVKIK